MWQIQFLNFTIYLCLQGLSILGSAVTQFAIPVWVFQKFGNASSVTTGAAVIAVTRVIVGPFTGVFVDRISKQKALLIAEIGQASVIGLLLLLLSSTPNVNLILIYCLLALSSGFDTLHFPALTSTVPLVVNKADLTRANGMISFIESGSNLMAPALASLILSFGSIQAILSVDLISFFASIFAVIFILKGDFSLAKKPPLGSQKGILSEIKETIEFLRKSQLARRMLISSAIANFLIMASFVLFTPMILSSNKNKSLELGIVLGIGSLSQLIVSGSLSMIRIHAFQRNIFFGYVFMGSFGMIGLALSNGPTGWAIGVATFMGAIPLLNTCSRSIWQSHIPQSKQGKFFATRRAISHASTPIAMVLSGFLVDHVLSGSSLSFMSSGYKTALLLYGVFMVALGFYCIFRLKDNLLVS